MLRNYRVLSAPQNAGIRLPRQTVAILNRDEKALPCGLKKVM